MLHRNFAAALTLGLALLTSAWLLRPRAPAPVDDHDAALLQKIAALDAEVRALRVTSIASHAIAAPSVAPPSAPHGAHDDVVDANLEAEGQQANARPDLLRTLESEGRDAVWSAGAEKKIERALGDADLAGSRVESTECKESGCIVTIAHDDVLARMRAVDWIEQHAPFSSGGTLYADGNRTIASFARTNLDGVD